MKEQRKIATHTLQCSIAGNVSHRLMLGKHTIDLEGQRDAGMAEEVIGRTLSTRSGVSIIDFDLKDPLTVSPN